VSLPHLLLVDDSEAVLSFETKVLEGRYALSVAHNGLEALAKVQEIRPDAMLLDLSMPDLGGREVLQALRADKAFVHLPVLIVTSESHREQELLAAGANGFLPKPLRNEALLSAVDRLLTEAAERARQSGLSVVFLGIGELEIGIPLLSVERVLMQPATTPLAGGPSFLSQMFVFEGEPLGILDLGVRLGIPHRSALVERKLVILDRVLVPFAIQVDTVEDPEDFEAAAVRLPGPLGFQGQGGLGELVAAVVQTDRGLRPVIDPRALVSRRALRELPRVVRELAGKSFGELEARPALGSKESSA
jgi:CheY-like chemotaxis protein/chemotaxis signal transduction protein